MASDLLGSLREKWDQITSTQETLDRMDKKKREGNLKRIQTELGRLKIGEQHFHGKAEIAYGLMLKCRRKKKNQEAMTHYMEWRACCDRKLDCQKMIRNMQNLQHS